MHDRPRQSGGDETWCRLQEWTKGQKASERLACTILQSEGYAVDPSHPLGGKDRGKDLLCKKDDLTLVGAAYFPRGQQTFKAIKKKFTDDLQGVAKHNAGGLVFVTNQELSLGERRLLERVIKDDAVVELYHLERLASLLNTPKNYGIRFEYLEMRPTEAEYLSFLAFRDEEHYRRIQEVNGNLDLLLKRIEKQTNDLIGYATGGDSYPVFTPTVFVGTLVVQFALQNISTYPVYDIHSHYIDLDEPVNIRAGRYYTRHPHFLPSLYPNKYICPVWAFDMTHQDRISIQITIRTRSTGVVQQFRMFRIGTRILIAEKTEAGGKVVTCHVPDTVPNYNPADPESVFRPTPLPKPSDPQ